MEVDVREAVAVKEAVAARETPVAVATISSGSCWSAASAETVTLEIADLEASYLVGTSFNVPEKVTVDIDGTKIEAENGVLIYPDGSVRGKGTYILKENGKYTISY